MVEVDTSCSSHLPETLKQVNEYGVRSAVCCLLFKSSHLTRSNLSSTSFQISHVTMVAAKARAEAEAALSRVSFSNKEIEIKTEKARLEATLNALEKEKQKLH